MNLGRSARFALLLAIVICIQSFGMVRPSVVKAAPMPSEKWVKISDQGLTSIAYGNGIYAALTTASEPKLVTSTDLETWAEQDIGDFTRVPLFVRFVNGEFVIGTQYHNIQETGPSFLYSDDGTNWTKTGSAEQPPQFSITAVAYGNGTYVASEFFGRTITSEDGIIWTAPVNTLSDISDVRFVNGWFVASGAQEVFVPEITESIALSKDGVNWSITDLQDPGTFGLTLASDGIRVLAANFFHAYRFDVEDASGVQALEVIDEFTFNNFVKKVGYADTDNGIFIAVGDSGKIKTSPDTVTWQDESVSGTGAGFTDVIEAQGTAVAVGPIGVYQRIPQIPYASGLTVTATDAAGKENDGKTIITVSQDPGSDNRFVYRNFGDGSIPVPRVGAVLSDYTALPENGMVVAANGDNIGVAEVDALDKAVKFGPVQAVVTAEPDYFTFDKATGTITGYSAHGPKDVVIPQEIEEVAVTSIGEQAFNGLDITSVLIPDGIVSIGDNAFYNNQLTAVTLPDSVTTIGANAFYQNQIQSLVLSQQLETIDQNVFRSNRLTSVQIPSSVKLIKNGAFRDNLLTGELTLPENLMEIGSAAFADNLLTSVVVPSKANIVGERAFANNHLESVIISEGVKNIHSKAFGDNRLTAVAIPISVERIEDGAFSRNRLVWTSILNKDAQIGNDAFADQETAGNLTIFGHRNSTAKDYAEANEHSFSSFIGLSRTDTYTFPAATADYSSVEPAEITVTKYVYGEFGGLAVSLSGANAGNFEWSALGLTKLDDTVKQTTFTVAPKLGLAAGTYEAVVSLTAHYGISESFEVRFTVAAAPQAPIITMQPQSRTVTEGHAVEFAVSAASETPLSYQWKKDGTDIPGATLASFTIPSVEESDKGHYTVVVTNVAGSVTSETAELTVRRMGEFALTATRGNGYASLTWAPVSGAASYSVYMNDALEDTVSGDVYGYHVSDLENGRHYQFAVRALDEHMQLIAQSNQAGVTPATAPGAPTNVTATAGDGSAVIRFTAPQNDGGSAITGYEVTASPGDIVVTGAASPLTVTGLSNGTTYTFTVKAMNGVDSSAASAVSNAVTPSAPPSDGGDEDNGGSPVQPTPPSAPTAPSAPPALEPANTGVNVLVNGKAESAGTATTAEVNGQQVIIVTVDEAKLQQRLDAEGAGALITIPVITGGDVVVGELNGRMIKNMEALHAVIEIRTAKATYVLPAQQINIDAVSERFGTNLALQDIKVKIEIAAPPTETVHVVEEAANRGGLTLVVPPLNFKVSAVYGDRAEEVTEFNAYVERTVMIPEGIDPDQITTGVVIDPDGTVRHVPTMIVVMDGVYYARINSLTNSTYSVVWHPLEFRDMANHWAKDAVNDMGSRMVVNGTGGGMFNPDQDITRAEFAAIIVRGLGLRMAGEEHAFTDVRETDWHNSAIHTAYEYRLINGYEDGTFRPDEKITRQQAMLIVSRAMAITGLPGNRANQSAANVLRAFSDVDRVSNWAIEGVADSVSAGIVTGREGEILAPNAYITRAEVATIIRRLLQKSELINE